MPLRVNLRHLELHNLTLTGELSMAELDLADVQEDMVRFTHPLQHELEVQKLDDSVLLRGRLVLPLDCECVRCLKPFQHKLELVDWACCLPLEGEDRVSVVDDSVDLTPILREDILLAFPAHPVCDPECGGLAGKQAGSTKDRATSPTDESSSAWSELDKLKFRS
jgi:uncharacterized metal-binding protein YceD (DUF177 family)